MKCQHCGMVGDESDGITGVTLYDCFHTISCDPCYNEFMLILRGDGNALNWETDDARLRVLRDAITSGGPNQVLWMKEYVDLRVSQFQSERVLIKMCKEYYSGENDKD